LFRKSDSKQRQEDVAKDYNDFKEFTLQQLQGNKLQPEEAMDNLRAKYVESTTKIEDINREDPKYRVSVFEEMLGDTMQIKTKLSLLGFGGGVELPDRGETDKKLLITDENNILVQNVKDASNIEYELAGTSWYKWGALFGAKPFELNNLRCLKALIRTQYIIMRQNSLIIEQLKKINTTNKLESP
jgi:hypothetical protein